MEGLTILADLGNTRFKWAVWAQERLSEPSYLERDLPNSVQTLVERWRVLGPERLVVASVLDRRVNQALENAASRMLGMPIEWVRVPVAGHGIHVGYADPSRLGVDRYLALVAGWERQGGPFVVIDCGTAVTIDAMDETGRHRGGLIFPGPGLMRASLARGTARIAHENAPTPDEVGVFGQDTESAIAGGVMHAVAAAIDRVCTDMEQVLSPGCVRIITGGDASLFSRRLRGRYIHEPVLTLKGLTTIVRAGHGDA